MAPTLNGRIPVLARDLRVDNVDDLPLLTIDQTEVGGEVRTFALAPDACAALVDSLCGVASATPGEVRCVIKMRAEDFARFLVGGGK